MMLNRDLFIDNSRDFLAAHRAALRSLRGKEIGSSWVAWDKDEDAWFKEEAVVLEVGGNRLEVVCWKMNEIALTWNTIDLDSRPAWLAEWGPDFDLEWRQDALAPLRRARGATVADVRLVEYVFRTEVISDRLNSRNVGRRHESWLLNGIELQHDAGTLLVFNGLDENGVTDECVTGDDYRKIDV